MKETKRVTIWLGPTTSFGDGTVHLGRTRRVEINVEAVCARNARWARCAQVGFTLQEDALLAGFRITRDRTGAFEPLRVTSCLTPGWTDSWRVLLARFNHIQANVGATTRIQDTTLLAREEEINCGARLALGRTGPDKLGVIMHILDIMHQGLDEEARFHAMRAGTILTGEDPHAIDVQREHFRPVGVNEVASIRRLDIMHLDTREEISCGAHREHGKIGHDKEDVVMLHQATMPLDGHEEIKSRATRGGTTHMLDERLAIVVQQERSSRIEVDVDVTTQHPVIMRRDTRDEINWDVHEALGRTEQGRVGATMRIQDTMHPAADEQTRFLATLAGSTPIGGEHLAIDVQQELFNHTELSAVASILLLVTTRPDTREEISCDVLRELGKIGRDKVGATMRTRDIMHRVGEEGVRFLVTLDGSTRIGEDQRVTDVLVEPTKTAVANEDVSTLHRVIIHQVSDEHIRSRAMPGGTTPTLVARHVIDVRRERGRTDGVSADATTRGQGITHLDTRERINCHARLVHGRTGGGKLDVTTRILGITRRVGDEQVRSPVMLDGITLIGEDPLAIDVRRERSNHAELNVVASTQRLVTMHLDTREETSWDAHQALGKTGRDKVGAITRTRDIMRQVGREEARFLVMQVGTTRIGGGRHATDAQAERFSRIELNAVVTMPLLGIMRRDTRDEINWDVHQERGKIGRDRQDVTTLRQATTPQDGPEGVRSPVTRGGTTRIGDDPLATDAPVGLSNRIAVNVRVTMPHPVITLLVTRDETSCDAAPGGSTPMQEERRATAAHAIRISLTGLSADAQDVLVDRRRTWVPLDAQGRESSAGTVTASAAIAESSVVDVVIVADAAEFAVVTTVAMATAATAAVDG